MRAHLAYLRYVIRHKWFVFVECVKLGIPWLGLVHDWSKLLPVEWFAYVHSFYNPDGSKRGVRDKTGYYDPWSIDASFDRAWLHHQHCNAHHWQHWILVQDVDPTAVLRMPDRYMKEMLADWRGAGWAITGKDNTLEWYEANKGKMVLTPSTRRWVEACLSNSDKLP